MRAGERCSSPGRRQVSSGSSSSTVRRPTRMASERARSRCPRARAASPVTHSRLALATARHGAIGIERELDRHQRPPLGDAEDVPGGDPVRRLHHQAALDRDARPAQPGKSAPGNARIGILDGAHDTGKAGADDGVGARRRHAVVRARLERHVHGGAARTRPGAGDGLGLGVRAPTRRRPAARDDLAGRSSAMTAPTDGLGAVRPSSAHRHAQRDLHHLGVEAGALRGAHGAQCFLSGAVSTTELSKAMCAASCAAAGSAAISPSTSWKSDASRKSR